MRKNWLAPSRTALVVLLVACGPGTPDQPWTGTGSEAAAASISAADVIERIGVLAADSMRGRDTPSPELDEVAEWIASEFQRFGLEPAFAGDYVQRYAIRNVAPDLTSSRASLESGGELAFGEDLSFATGPAEGHLRGAVVVVTGEAGWEEGLGERGLEGRHVVLLPPAGQVPLRTRTGRQLLRALRNAGALSVLVATDVDRQTFRGDAALQAQQTAFRLEGESGTPTLAVRQAALAGGFGIDVEALRRPSEAPLAVTDLPDVVLTLDLAVRVISEARAPNVAGILRGSDPELRDEYVVYSAHMDHVGVGAPVDGDSIWNGADDDASGTATVMEVAQAFSGLDLAPRRSLLFLLVSGEEKGLWGSRFFAEHPPVPLSQVAADLNVDMVGRNWPDTIVAIGREHSELGTILAEVNEAHPEIGMTAIDDIWPEESFYTRSDHFNFARKGVPILFFFNGTHPDYHRPSDEVERIDGEKTARIGRLLYYLGLEVANRTERPEWNAASRARIVEGG
ncbi:MAG: M28 family peptidase [Gemmatimonadota bacterium]